MSHNPSPVLLSAPILETWEQCPRKNALLRLWQPKRVTTVSALYRAINDVLYKQHDDIGLAASRRYMEIASRAGVETRGRWDRYESALHHAALSEVLAIVLKEKIGQYKVALESPQLKELEEHCGLWQLSSALRTDNHLWRFVLVDHWDDDRLYSEMHSWRTMGDLAVAGEGARQTITVAVIGNSLKGRRHGLFTKGKYNQQFRKLQFQHHYWWRQTAAKRKRHDWGEGWHDIWREEHKEIETAVWIRQMKEDRMLEEVLFDININPLSEKQREAVLKDIKRISQEIPSQGEAASPENIPMRRSACDGTKQSPNPCVFQCCCYAPEGYKSPEETGNFVRRK